MFAQKWEWEMAEKGVKDVTYAQKKGWLSSLSCFRFAASHLLPLPTTSVGLPTRLDTAVRASVLLFEFEFDLGFYVTDVNTFCSHHTLRPRT